MMHKLKSQLLLKKHCLDNKVIMKKAILKKIRMAFNKINLLKPNKTKGLARS